MLGRAISEWSPMQALAPNTTSNRVAKRTAATPSTARHSAQVTASSGSSALAEPPNSSRSRNLLQQIARHTASQAPQGQQPSAFPWLSITDAGRARPGIDAFLAKNEKQIEEMYNLMVERRAAGFSTSSSSCSQSQHVEEQRAQPPSEPKEPAMEQRKRPFLTRPLYGYEDRLARARSQRLFLLDRELRARSKDGLAWFAGKFTIAGTTGNVYRVIIDRVLSCTCPDFGDGYTCKHIIHVMVNILKAPRELRHQNALLSTELTSIFAHAPPAGNSVMADNTKLQERKLLEGECPICMMEFATGDVTVWCKASCGNNIHQECFIKWLTSKGGEVECVYCRAPWQHEGQLDCGIQKALNGGRRRNKEGYVNVARELGISGVREPYRGRWRRYDEWDDYDDHGDGNEDEDEDDSDEDEDDIDEDEDDIDEDEDDIDEDEDDSDEDEVPYWMQHDVEEEDDDDEENDLLEAREDEYVAPDRS